MKTELRVRPHNILSSESVVELWHCGKLIGTVTGADGPGVRVISKYRKDADATDPFVTQVAISVGELEVAP